MLCHNQIISCTTPREFTDRERATKEFLDTLAKKQDYRVFYNKKLILNL